MNPYPSRSQLQAEAAAETRDLGNLLALRQMRLILTEALTRAEMVHPLDHPWCRYEIADTLAALRDELASVDAAAAYIEASTVLEDA